MQGGIRGFWQKDDIFGYPHVTGSLYIFRAVIVLGALPLTGNVTSRPVTINTFHNKTAQ